MTEPGSTSKPVRQSVRRVTLADVADRAGVSTATASLVLSGREEYLKQFREDTIDRVRRSAKRLGYRANLMAAGLPTRNPLFFALVIRDFGGRQEIRDWHLWAFEGELLAGAVKVASQHGLFPIVATIDLDAPDAGVAATERVITGGVLGAIVRAQNPPLESFLRNQLNAGQRVVAVFPDQISAWPENAVLADNMLIGRTAGELLAHAGRKRWGLMCYRTRPMRESHKLRCTGFKQAAEAAGATVETITLPRKAHDIGNRELNRLRKVAPDGLFAVDSVLSVSTMIACDKLDWRPPDDVCLVGVNCSQWHNSQLPPITSIDISWSEVGRIAIEQLIALSKDDAARFPSVLVEPRVRAGGTCVPFKGNRD